MDRDIKQNLILARKMYILTKKSNHKSMEYWKQECLKLREILNKIEKTTKDYYEKSDTYRKN